MFHHYKNTRYYRLEQLLDRLDKSIKDCTEKYFIIFQRNHFHEKRVHELVEITQEKTRIATC
jgi:hypothetical protein